LNEQEIIVIRTKEQHFDIKYCILNHNDESHSTDTHQCHICTQPFKMA